MHAFSPQKPTQQDTSADSAKPARSLSGPSREISDTLHLQRTLGNQAMQRVEPDGLEAHGNIQDTTRFAHDFSKIPVSSDMSARTHEREHFGHRPSAVSARATNWRPAAQVKTTATNGEPRVEHEQNATGMPIAVRTKMEQALGADFSAVRVHYESSRAAELGAVAFTQGHDIHVARANWTPETTQGQEILGHELVHVMQQRMGRVRTTAQMNGMTLNNEPTLEREADAMGRFAAQSSARLTTVNLDAGRGSAEPGRSASPRLPRSAEVAPQRLQPHFGARQSRPQAGGVCQLLPAASPWWPPIQDIRTVVINDHDFDFDKSGGVDGPLSHNGTYKIIENQPKSFKMQITVGTNDAHNNDLDATLAIKEGQATITGSVQGKTLEKPFTSPVSGAGTKVSPFSLSFIGEKGKKTTISWRTDA